MEKLGVLRALPGGSVSLVPFGSDALAPSRAPKVEELTRVERVPALEAPVKAAPAAPTVPADQLALVRAPKEVPKEETMAGEVVTTAFDVEKFLSTAAESIGKEVIGLGGYAGKALIDKAVGKETSPPVVVPPGANAQTPTQPAAPKVEEKVERTAPERRDTLTTIALIGAAVAGAAAALWIVVAAARSVFAGADDGRKKE
jgi:hypothetical protein